MWYPARIVPDVRGSELRAIRDRLRLTQAEMAVRLGVHWNTQARYERDELPVPEPVARLARVFDEARVSPRGATRGGDAVPAHHLGEQGRKVRRGTFRLGVHYFQPQGRGTKLIFKWSAVVALIESRAGVDEPAVRSPETDKVIDVEKATTGLRRLLAG